MKSTSWMKLCLCLLAAFSFYTKEVNAASSTWLGVTDEWSNSSNWSNGLPGVGVSAIFGLAPTTQVINSATLYIPTLSFTSAQASYTITNDGALHLTDTGIENTTGISQIITNNNHVYFENSSTAFDVNFYNNNNLYFMDTSNAASSTLINVTGNIYFNDSASASTAAILNTATVYFNDTSSAGSSTLINDGDIFFLTDSHADQSFIANHANLSFDDNSSSDQAFIISDGTLSFLGNSIFGNSGIANYGTLLFSDNSDAINGVISNYSGGHIDISGHTGTLHLGYLDGAGSVFLGNNNLEVGAQQMDSIIDGVISGNGNLIKVGTGSLTLNGINTYTGETTVSEGFVIIGDTLYPAATVASEVNVGANGAVGGHGTIGNNLVNAGLIAPGWKSNSTLDIGTLTVSGNYTQHATATYFVAIGDNTETALLDVGGEAFLDGNVEFLPLTHGFLTAYSYTALTAQNGVNGTFSTVFQPDYLTINVTYLPNSVEYDITINPTEGKRKSIFAAASTKNQRAVADYIINHQTTPAVNKALFSMNKDGQVSAFLEKLGSQYQNQQLTLSKISASFSDILYQRISNRNNECISDLTCSSIGGWAVQQKESQKVNSLRVDNTTMGFHEMAIGTEFLLNKGQLVGIGFEQTNFKMVKEGSALLNEGKLYQFGIYSLKEFNKLRVGLSGNYGIINDGVLERTVVSPVGTGILKAEQTATILGIQTNGNYLIEVQPHFLFQGLAGLNYQYITQKRFLEKGNTGLELFVVPSDYQNLHSQLGMRFSRIAKEQKETSSFIFMWEHELYASTGGFEARWLNAQESFGINPTKSDRNAFSVKSEFLLAEEKEWELYVSYQNYLSEELAQNSIGFSLYHF